MFQSTCTFAEYIATVSAIEVETYLMAYMAFDAEPEEKEVYAIYKQYAPEKLKDVPTTLKKYEGRLPELVQRLRKKYAVPASFGAATAQGTPSPDLEDELWFEVRQSNLK